jgi:4-hydroxy-3-methylbut-2-en-1-yl diphosphate synthase IspG/GcpE
MKKRVSLNLPTAARQLHASLETPSSTVEAMKVAMIGCVVNDPLRCKLDVPD